MKKIPAYYEVEKGYNYSTGKDWSQPVYEDKDLRFIKLLGKYEKEKCAGEEILELFCVLVKTGAAAQLGGKYIEAANRMIEAGIITDKGEIIEKKEEELPVEEKKKYLWKGRSGFLYCYECIPRATSASAVKQEEKGECCLCHKLYPPKEEVAQLSLEQLDRSTAITVVPDNIKHAN
jgi:hypothetical protein